MSDITDELKSAQGGEHKSQLTPATRPLTDLVVLPSTNIILGNVGAGKSGLAYHLLDVLSQKYELLPIAVNFPVSKKNLLPERYVIKTSEDLKRCENFIALVDEGTTKTPAGDKEAEERMKSFNSLSRQRHSIIIYIYHSSSDVGSRILRGIYGAIMLKEPSQRQILYGAKDRWMRDLLTTAKQKFKALQELGEDTRAWTYVDTEKPEFQGMVKNGLVSWWSDDLSCAWAGVDTDDETPIGKTGGALSMIDLFKARDTDLETIDQYFDHMGVPQELRDRVCQLDGEYTLEDLRRICQEQNVPVSGDKKKLVWRLMEAGYFEGGEKV